MEQEDEKLERWFIKPSGYEDALTGMALVADFYIVSDLWLQPSQTQSRLFSFLFLMLKPTLSGLNKNTTLSTGRIYNYLLQQKPELVQSSDESEVLKVLQGMFDEGLLHRSALREVL